VLLISDDREPGRALLWLFALVLLPVVGLVLLLFFGRDWKVITGRLPWARTFRASVITRMHPVHERNAATDAVFRERYGRTCSRHSHDHPEREWLAAASG